MELTASPDLLIGQWADSPKLRGTVQAFVDPLENEALVAIDRLKLMREIETAEGWWLDQLGIRYGVRRPATTDPSADERFGFDDAGVGFDVAPLRGDAANDSVYPLPDIVYRLLVKARAILVTGDGTFQTFVKAVRIIDPGATVADNRDMTVRVLTNKQVLLELADSADALPRTAGVLVNFAARDAFGFDLAGKGYDQAPFRVD